MEQDEIEHFGPLANIFIPLSQASSSSLRLHRQILEKAKEASIFDIGCLGFDELLDLFQVVEDFVRLLHIILIARLEHASLTLLSVEESQLYLYVHRILKLFDALFHGAEIACKVVL